MKLTDPTEAEFKAFGLAGMAVVYSLTGKSEQAAKAMAELAPLRSKLDPRMGALVSFAVQQNRKAMDAKAAHEWDEWLKTLPSEPLDETNTN